MWDTTRSSSYLDELQELAHKEIIEMIERLLLEADLEGELSKLQVYGKTIDGIKELLNFLLMDPITGRKINLNKNQMDN